MGIKTQSTPCLSIIEDNNPDTDTKMDLVALCGTRIVGWCFLWNLDTGKPTFGLGIADEYQGKGLGSELMNRMMRTARERGLNQVYLVLVKDNEVARRMYERHGFTPYDEYVEQDGLTYLRMSASFMNEA